MLALLSLSIDRNCSGQRNVRFLFFERFNQSAHFQLAWGRCPWSVLTCMRYAVGVIGPLSSEDQSFGLSTILICCYVFPAEARPYCLIGVN